MFYFSFIFQRDHLKIAQQFFQLVGGSASECGTLNLNLIHLIVKNWTVRACVSDAFLAYRYYSWQTVHGLLLLPLETVWRCSHISELSQGECSSAQSTHYIVYSCEESQRYYCAVVSVCEREMKKYSHTMGDVTWNDKWCFTDAVHLFRCVFSSSQWVSLPIKCQHLVCTCVWILTFFVYICAFLLTGLLL